jgi:sec-independent protein translocase protein TatC
MCLLYGVSIGLVYIFGKAPTEAERTAWRNRKQKEKDEGDASSS